MIAIARGRQVLDGITHSSKCRDFRIDLTDMVKRQAFDVGAGAALSCHRSRSRRMRSIEKPRSRARRIKRKIADIVFAINAVAAFAAARGGDQAGRFVIADRLGGHAGSFGGLPDIHICLSNARTGGEWRTSLARWGFPLREGQGGAVDPAAGAGGLTR